MRHLLLFVASFALLAGCPTRSNPDSGTPGMDAPRIDSPVACVPGDENTTAACSDGCSNDTDTFADCEDRDCCGLVACGAGTFCGSSDAGPPVGACDGGTSDENTVAACSDGCDNDDDRFADCNDFGCCALVTCGAGTACARDGGPPIGGACDGGLGTEDEVASCTDGCDNNDDGFTDCNDYDCCGVVTCGATTACGRRDGGGCEEGPERDATTCADGCSNDGDTYVDCEDRDCCGARTCPTGTFCGDLGDAGPRPDGGPRFGTCDGGTRAENTAATCGNGCDDDGDGYSDCNDYGCCGAVTCGPSTSCGRVDGGGCMLGMENTPAACADGCSNDGDRFVDCEDRDCCGRVTCGATTYCGRDAG